MPITINKSLRLSSDQYIHSKTNKTGICIHHTVGGSAKSTFNWWVKDQRRVATAYIIGRDGEIFEVFDPEYWAFQFGLKSTNEWTNDERYTFESRFIGIELASEGGLTESDGELYAYDKISDRTRKDPSEAFDYGALYRGYRFFDKYETEQKDSLIELMKDLFDKFGISKKVPSDKLAYYGKKVKDFEGVIGHTMVRKDKSDPAPDMDMWQRIISECGLTEVEINGNEVAATNKLNANDIEELFNQNMDQVDKMDIGSGSMVKQVVLELEEEKTYIKLSNAVEGGHTVDYQLLEGKKDLIYAFGNYLGFHKITENRIEVLSG